MIFHSQGHSSSTESDLSSLIPVEISAPVLEVFEVSANEVGAIFNSPNLQQFLMKNHQSWKHLCHTVPQTGPLEQLSSEKTICPFCLLLLMSDIVYQETVSCFRFKKEGIWTMSNENLVIIASSYSSSSFCGLATSAQLAYRDCQPTLRKCYVKSYSFSCIHTVTTAQFITVSCWNTVIWPQAWVLNFCTSDSSPPIWGICNKWQVFRFGLNGVSTNVWYPGPHSLSKRRPSWLWIFLCGHTHLFFLVSHQ